MTITYEYDTIGNVKKILKNGTAIYSCELDANMQLIREQDYEANTETQYFYTDAGSLYLSRKTCGDDVILSYTITDDETGKTDNITEINGTKITYSSVYDEEAEIYKYILPNLTEITSDTDDFGRTTAVYLKDADGNTLLSCTYTYVDKTVDEAVHTSEYVASMSMGGKTFTYAYDANGNITSVSDGAYVTTYVYDNLGQLTRENNQRAGKSWTYTYDTAGNILSKSEYAYTTGELGTAASAVTYGYSNSNWGDQLTSYNGTAISYDSLGNPLNWTDGRTFTWEGRQLSSITSSDETISFTYNADGLRTKKVVGIGEDAYTYEYIWDNGLLVAETETYCGEELISYYYYDENGSPVAWNWDGDIYYYVKNLQGDIVRIVDESGASVAEYTYDAWGNVLTETGNYYIRTYNPFRYRGYYYDVETELYYLQSRYYDPAVGRFLNADAVDYLGATGTVLGYNLYAYCGNNVVNFFDPCGTVETGVIAFAIDITISLVSAYAKYSYDAIGWTIKNIIKKINKKFLKKKKIPLLLDILNGPIKKITGWGGRFLTKLKTVLYRIGFVGLSAAINGIVEATNLLIKHLTKLIKPNASDDDIEEAFGIITGLLSTGGAVATLLDLSTDGKINGKIKLW